LLLNSVKFGEDYNYMTVVNSFDILVKIIVNSVQKGYYKLLREFTSNNGEILSSSLLNKYESNFEKDTNSMRDMMKNYLEIIFLGEKELKIESYEEIQLESDHDKDIIPGKTIKNISAYQYLINSFLKSNSVSLILKKENFTKGDH
jgi:hypothetical protein